MVAEPGYEPDVLSASGGTGGRAVTVAGTWTGFGITRVRSAAPPISEPALMVYCIVL